MVKKKCLASNIFNITFYNEYLLEYFQHEVLYDAAYFEKASMFCKDNSDDKIWLPLQAASSSVTYKNGHANTEVTPPQSIVACLELPG